MAKIAPSEQPTPQSNIMKIRQVVSKSLTRHRLGARPDDPAYPDMVMSTEVEDCNGTVSQLHRGTSGLTKRELISAMLLQGILSNTYPDAPFESEMVTKSLNLADKLISKLCNKEKK